MNNFIDGYNSGRCLNKGWVVSYATREISCLPKQEVLVKQDTISKPA